MNRRLLVVLSAGAAIACAAYAVYACSDKTGTSASNVSVTASGNAACTAACKAHGAKSGATGASTADMTARCPYHDSNAAVTASASGACSHASGASATRASGAGAMTAGTGSCSAHSMASASGSCAHKGAAAAFEAMSPGGSSCGGKGVGTMASHSAMRDCDACADMANCESELKSAGSNFQVVPLKNGVMYVYTADGPRNVRTVQSAIARRTERINAIVTADNAKLCPDCKQMRGAMASGKLTREVVNIEGGAISLVTSTDPAMVARLYAMAGLSPQKGVKS